MTTFSDAPSVAAEGRRSRFLRAGDRLTHVVEIDHPVDNSDGVAAAPDVVAVALYMHAASAAKCGVRLAVARVTRKGGRVALTTWLPDSNLFKMFLVMKPYMPPPSNPAPPSPFAWGTAERVRELLGTAFDLRFERGTSFYREPSGEAAWNTFSVSYGPTKALAGNLDEARRAELRRDFIAFHDGFP